MEATALPEFVTDDGVRLRPGARVRASSTRRHGSKLGGVVLPLSERCEVRALWRRGARVFAECVRLEKGVSGGALTLFVAGRGYRPAGLPELLIRPCRLRRLRPSPSPKRSA